MSQTADRCCTGERGNCLHFTITAGNGAYVRLPPCEAYSHQGRINLRIHHGDGMPPDPRLAPYENWHSKSKRTIVTAQGDGAPKVAATKNRALALRFEAPQFNRSAEA